MTPQYTSKDGRKTPPAGPPNRTFKDTILRGLVETKKSKQATRKYERYMKDHHVDTGSAKA